MIVGYNFLFTRTSTDLDELIGSRLSFETYSEESTHPDAGTGLDSDSISWETREAMRQPRIRALIEIAVAE